MMDDRWNAGTTHFINSFSKTSLVVKLMTEKLEPFMVFILCANLTPFFPLQTQFHTSRVILSFVSLNSHNKIY